MKGTPLAVQPLRASSGGVKLASYSVAVVLPWDKGGTPRLMVGTAVVPHEPVKPQGKQRPQKMQPSPARHRAFDDEYIELVDESLGKALVDHQDNDQGEYADAESGESLQASSLGTAFTAGQLHGNNAEQVSAETPVDTDTEHVSESDDNSDCSDHNEMDVDKEILRRQMSSQ